MNESPTQPREQSPTLPTPTLGSLWYVATIIALMAALLISLFLLWVSWSNPSTIPGCGANSTFDCESVLASRWSKWLGVPVSLFAVGAYSIALIGLYYTSQSAKPKQQQLGWTLLVMNAITVIGAGGWFVALQVSKLDAICIWCMSAHACGLVFAVLALVGAVKVSSNANATGGGNMVVATIVAMLALTVLIGGQVFIQPKQMDVQTTGGGRADIDTGEGVERTVTFLEGRFGLKPYAFPMLGSPDAKYIAAYIYDYTCPHCRSLHDTLDLMLKRYGDQLGIVVLPMPLDSQCNELVEETHPRHAGACDLAMISMAVWKQDASKFLAMHKWMMHGSEIPTPEQARKHAIELIGEDALAEAMKNPWPAEQIGRNIGLYERLGQGSIPKLFVRNIYITGRAGTPEQMYKVFEDELDIQPLDVQRSVPLVESEEHQDAPEEAEPGRVVE